MILGLLELVRGALVVSLIPLFGQFEGGYSLGVVGTAIFWLYFLDNLFRIPSGWVIDRYGGKWLVMTGIIVSGIGLLMLNFHWGEKSFVLGAGLCGLGIAPIWPAVITNIVVKLPLQRTGEALSKVFIAWLVGAGIGMVTINFLIGQSFNLAFISLAGVLVIALGLALFTPWPGSLTEKIVPLRMFAAGLGKELLSLKILYPGMFVQTMCIGILTPVIAVYARSEFGFSNEQFAVFLIGAGALTVLLLLPAGKLADYVGIKTPLIAGFVMAALGLVFLPLQTTIFHAIAWGSLIGIAYALILPAWNGLMARAVSADKMGTMWAAFMTIEGIGTAVGAYLGGKAWDTWGHRAPFWACAAVLMSMVIFYASGNIDRFAFKTDYQELKEGRK